MLKLAYRNIKVKPFSTLLTMLLFATGVSIITVVLLTGHQFSQQFKKNLADIDMVVGAKGSPMQLILSSVYHIDNPTGNISQAEARLVEKNPYVERAIPLSLGDNYKKFRIVGTTHQYAEMYKATVAEGKQFEQTLEVTIGSVVAAELGMKVGDTFNGAHGLSEESLHSHDEHNYVVVGIYNPTGTVLDQLILTNLESIWAVHDEHGEADEAEHEHEHAHDHDHEHEFDDDEFDAADFEGTIPIEEEPKPVSDGKEITALLVTFKAPIAQLTVPRMINENTLMQSASPVFESERLFSLIGVGVDALEKLAYFIMFISALSIFISLYQSLKDRRYEIAIMRVMGGSRGKVLLMVLLEGVILALLGALLGLALSHGVMAILASYLQAAYHYSFSGAVFIPAEGVVVAVSLGIGLLAAIIPAINASKTDISRTLAKA